MSDPLTEGIKLGQEGAKLGQEVSKTAREGMGFVERCFPNALRGLDRFWAQKLWFREYKGWAKFAKEVQGQADMHGLPGPTRDIPLKLLLPLAEAGAIEDDDLLREMWARMWVNAADADHGAEVRRAYVSILSDCTRLDVRILATLYNAAPELRGRSAWAGHLPDKAQPWKQGDQRAGTEVTKSLWNLRRHGLITSDADPHPDPDSPVMSVSLTTFGIGLVEACTLRDRGAAPALSTAPPAGHPGD